MLESHAQVVTRELEEFVCGINSSDISHIVISGNCQNLEEIPSFCRRTYQEVNQFSNLRLWVGEHRVVEE